MKIGIHDYNEFNNHNNAIFKLGTNSIGENLEYPFIALKEMLEHMGHSLDTLDMYPIEEFDHIIFIDFPKKNAEYFKALLSKKIKLHLILLESPLIKPENFILDNHKWFETIFTWDSKLVDDRKYFKIQIAHKFPDSFEYNIKDKTKFCTIIAGNKRGKNSTELYSERKRAIKWFDKNCPEKFDVYGFGWDKYEFHGLRIIRIFNRIDALKKLLRPRLRTYRGPVKSKIAILKSYKFSICYENIRNVPDYITEKIFDSFFGACVPIYLGAPNIGDYIPRNCYINKNDFRNYKELYEHLIHMTDNEYEGYLKNIQGFLCGPKADMFKASYFASLISGKILEQKNA